MKNKTFYIVVIFLLVFGSIRAEGEEKMEKATFAGGCFWCMEGPFERIEGVEDVVAGYTGGGKNNPTYEEVSAGKTDHAEAIQITYNPSKVTYPELIEVFWRQIDPTDPGGQFADRGSQYRTAIFYHNADQKAIAEKSRDELEKSGIYNKPIVTEITEAGDFYKAEEYHQDYHKKCPVKYGIYREGSDRSKYLEAVWGRGKKLIEKQSGSTGTGSKPTKKELKKKLTPLQYKVTQECGTEAPFDNEYWDNKCEGIYVDVVSGEPLFSSTDKFVSGTGWPSFTKPIEFQNIVEKKDRRLFTVRTEVKSKGGDSHLGHLFDDGPAPRGKRYCINSSSLKFIPKEDLEKEGYGEYEKLFEKE